MPQPPHIIDVKRKTGEQVYGYLLSRNSKLVVVREFDGFLPAGFVAMPTSTVVDLLINEPWTRMIAAEGHANFAQAAPWFRTDSMRSALESIHETNVNIKIECKNCPDAEEFGLHIGRIVAMGDSSLEFVFFDSVGRWFDNSYAIPYASITQVVVDDPYVTTFSRYVGPCPVETEKSG
ncbi:hypothetical protein GC197_03580 [bacterium]|nr:hypothetical protein [bacterium]